jgi:mannose-6-phosphate isomerase-like protein (cupin superfamily)
MQANDLPELPNLYRDHLAPETGCHDGVGTIGVFRPYQRRVGSELVDHIDFVMVPPGASIGRHRHGDNTEWYVILSGEGTMWFGGQLRAVKPGDMLVNPPFGEHGLVNESGADVHLMVFQVSRSATPEEH